MHGIGLQSLLGLQCAVQHHIGIGRGETSVNDNIYINQPRNYAFQGLQASLDSGLHAILLVFGQLAPECLQYNMLYHNDMFLGKRIYAFICKYWFKFIHLEKLVS